MQKKQKTILGGWMVGLGLVACGHAAAIGFGSHDPVATLGQPLDISIPVRLEPGENLEPECVAAEVSIGDIAVPPAGVGANLVVGASGVRAIRVRTLRRIDEPVVTVQVAAGCGQRLSRRYVVFADPPIVVAPPTMAAAPSSATLAPAPATAAVVSEPPPVVAAAPTPPPRAARPRARRAATSTPPRPAAAQRPRLRLDAPAPPAVAAPPDVDAMAAVDAANEAVKAAIAAASASQSRIAALEAEMRRLAADASSQREQMEQLRHRAAAAEGLNRWSWLLALGLLLLLGVALWLWRRLRELERARSRGWLDAARPAPASTPASAPPAAQVPMLVERSPRSTGVSALGAGLAPVHRPAPSELPSQPSTVAQDWLHEPDTLALRTQPLVPPAPAMPPPPPRDVSAEELIDLEQQAEFFVVLGQDEAAIDLLVSHLRDSGGASPLPYLKLLDIYRRRGDRAAYERTRDRFNHRFNAHVPGWDAPAVEGRSLEDYPAVMHWLERVWPKPLDAMAELESLLFRKDGGELFELPAYRELLLLYSLARDLLDSDTGGAGTTVDVLLPLSDGPGFASTTPRPYFGDDAPSPPEVQPTAPIDLDLDEPSEPVPPSELGRLR